MVGLVNDLPPEQGRAKEEIDRLDGEQDDTSQLVKEGSERTNDVFVEHSVDHEARAPERGAAVPIGNYRAGARNMPILPPGFS